MLDFAFHLNERIAHCKKIFIQIESAICRKTEITVHARDLESATQQLPSGPDVSRIWHNVSPEQHVGSGLEALQPASFDQLAADLAKLKPGPVIAEPLARDQTKPSIRVTRAVAVPALKTEISGLTDGECIEVRIREICRRSELDQNVHRREGYRIAHQR